MTSVAIEFDDATVSGVLSLSADWLQVVYDEALLADLYALEGTAVVCRILMTTSAETTQIDLTVNIINYTPPAFVPALETWNFYPGEPTPSDLTLPDWLHNTFAVTSISLTTDFGSLFTIDSGGTVISYDPDLAAIAAFEGTNSIATIGLTNSYETKEYTFALNILASVPPSLSASIGEYDFYPDLP